MEVMLKNRLNQYKVRFYSLINFRKLILTICLTLLTINGYTAGHKSFDVIAYGARNDGKTLSTRAIQTAIDDCSRSGGGTVCFPAGRYVSGTIYLRSNITLLLDAGAVLEGSKNLKDYPVTISNIRSYTDNYTNRSLIYAEDLEGIAITGNGSIDGNGASFNVSNIENDDGLRKRDDYYFYKSRPYLIRIINCRKILVRDITIMNSPMWVQHYLSCSDLIIEGITVKSRVNHNNDGIDIDGCENVRISACNIISGDDAVVLKSTSGRPCKNVTVTNCVLSSDCNAFKLGTETNGGFQNVVFSSSTIYDTHLAGITLQIVDGGTLDHVTVSDITMENVGTAIFIRLGNRARPYGDNMDRPGMGKLSHVIINNIQGSGIGKTGCSITGLPGYNAEDIILSDISLVFIGGGTSELAVREIPELPSAYPEYEMFGDLPAYGFYCRHCKNISLDNVVLGYISPEARPSLICDDVEDIRIRGLRASADSTTSVIGFNGVRSALIAECVTVGNPDNFLNLRGIENIHISMTGNDLSFCRTAVSGDNRSSVFLAGNRMPPSYGLSGGPFVNCGVQFTDDRAIRINTPAEIRNKRVQIIRAIWGKDQIPGRSDITLTRNIKSPLTTDPVVSRVDRLEIPVSGEPVAGREQLKDLAYLFVPVRRNSRLVILNPGHTCKLSSQPGSDLGIEAAIKGLLKAGYDVLSVFMPHVSETTCNLDHCSIMNTSLGPGEHPSTFGLRFFLEPEIVCLNYLLGVTHYDNVSMVGLSGGGWTTNLLAAIDTRIKYSFNIAGSMPLYYRSGGSIGDIEQFLPELYRDIAGYPDIYVLGAFGTGRRQVQILNRKDDCCFGEAQHDPERNWDEDLDSFELSVKDKLKSMGAEGHYYLVKDETATCHQISGYALNNVIIKELNSIKK